jgi:hypothetical protein
MGCPDMKIISVKINDVGRLNADKAFEVLKPSEI